MSQKNRLNIQFGQLKATIVSNQPSAHLEKVASEMEKKVLEIRESYPSFSYEKAILLNGLNLLSDKLLLEEENHQLKKELSDLNEKLASLSSKKELNEPSYIPSKKEKVKEDHALSSAVNQEETFDLKQETKTSSKGFLKEKNQDSSREVNPQEEVENLKEEKMPMIFVQDSDGEVNLFNPNVKTIQTPGQQRIDDIFRKRQLLKKKGALKKTPRKGGRKK